MNDITSPEIQVINEKAQISKPLHLEKNLIPSIEMSKPRTVVFGSIDVTEDLKTDLLTPHEKKIYRDGFNIFTHLVNSANDNITRLVLIHPDMSSGIVGIQPLVSLTTKEASLLDQSFKMANIDFNQDFSLLENKSENWLNLLINHNGAENVLRTYQTELDINLPGKKLQKDEILSCVTQLLNDTDIKRVNLALGLLSGFPLKDCLTWTNETYQYLKEVKNRPCFIKVKNQTLKLNQARMDSIDTDKYSRVDSRSKFLPDEKKIAPVNPFFQGKLVQGFGLRWFAPFPFKESTIKHCQRILQINREIGLLPFIHQQRATFQREDAINAIDIQKKLHGSVGKVGKVAGGILFGIYALFETVKKAMNPPENQNKKY